MKRILLGTTIIAGLMVAGTAQAADLRAPVYKAAPPAYFSWTGCYIGGNVGGVWGRSNINIPRYPSNFDIKDSSFVGGGQIGCNYQINQFVFGIEGDIEGMSVKGNHLSGGSFGERFRVDWDRSESLRGRIGYANNNWLFYFTGGGAWAHLKGANFIPTIFNDVSGGFSGWVVGGGIEYGLTQNWIIGVEYLHAEYNSRRAIFLGPVDMDLTTDTVRARLSYKFW